MIRKGAPALRTEGVQRSAEFPADPAVLQVPPLPPGVPRLPPVEPGHHDARGTRRAHSLQGNTVMSYAMKLCGW